MSLQSLSRVSSNNSMSLTRFLKNNGFRIQRQKNGRLGSSLVPHAVKATNRLIPTDLMDVTTASLDLVYTSQGVYMPP
uniref:Uncharacterized protein n=1 Tax=Arion vulgaris TaxID=1028688 RepID=A0A0B7AQ01_9EUPU